MDGDCDGFIFAVGLDVVGEMLGGDVVGDEVGVWVGGEVVGLRVGGDVVGGEVVGETDGKGVVGVNEGAGLTVGDSVLAASRELTPPSVIQNISRPVRDTTDNTNTTAEQTNNR